MKAHPVMFERYPKKATLCLSVCGMRSRFEKTEDDNSISFFCLLSLWCSKLFFMSEYSLRAYLLALTL